MSRSAFLLLPARLHCRAKPICLLLTDSQPAEQRVLPVRKGNTNGILNTAKLRNTIELVTSTRGLRHTNGRTDKW